MTFDKEDELNIIDKMQLGYAEHEMIYDANGVAVNYRYLKVNQMFCDLTNWEKKDLEGQLVTTIYPTVDLDRVKTYQQLFEGKKSLDFNSYFDEKNAWYHIKAYKTGLKTFITLFYDITDLIDTNDKLEYMLNHNIYSGMLNYDGFKERAKLLPHNQNYMCFVVTIKNSYNIFSFYGFDFINNLYAKIIKEFEKYTKKGHLVGHSSYNQIMLLLVNPTKEEMEATLLDAKKSLYVNYEIDNFEIALQQNIGYAVYEEGDDIDELIRKASIANVYSKINKRNPIMKYNKSLGKRIRDDVRFTRALNNAIKNDDINIYFQKIIDTKTGKVKYYEALTRWISSDFGFVSPEKIFDVALRSGMIDLVEQYIIEKTLCVYAKFKKESKIDSSVKLCMNLSSSALYKDNIEKMILKSTHNNNLKPAEICLEVSENTFVENIDLCIKKINKLKSYGYLIAIDDFGSRYSTIGILDKIPYDILKLDGLFAKKIDTYTMQSLVQSISNIVSHLDKKIIVERIETNAEAKLFKLFSCHIHQGYYYHKPENFIKNQKIKIV